MTGLESLGCLEKIKNYFPYVDLGKGKEYVCEKEFTTIKQALIKSEKEHKALEIILEKDVDIYAVRRSGTIEEYNAKFIIDDYQELTKEEFNLLKEVIMNG